MTPRPLLRWATQRHYVRRVPLYAEPDAPVARDLVQPGDSVIDVGANVGWYTNIFSCKAGSAGRVYAIEPVPPTFGLLSHVVRKLRLDNVILLNIAVSDTEGVAVMRVPIGAAGQPNFYRAAIDSESSTAEGTFEYKVPTRSLDDLVGPEEIGFVKWDVEGHELPAVLGAQRLIERCRPALLIELSSDADDPNSDAWKLRQLLEGLGYLMYWVDGAVIRPRQPKTRSTNYFFLQPNHLRLLTNRLALDDSR